MNARTVLSEPTSGNGVDLAAWIGNVARGAAAIMAHAASYPRPLDTELVTALAWLGIDLATIAEAAADYLETGRCELEKNPDGAERLPEMRRLLGIACDLPENSEPRAAMIELLTMRIVREWANPV